MMDRPPEDSEVQVLIARHYAWVCNFWTPAAESYTGLGGMYASDPEFRAFYERYAPNLADFLQAAMAHYAKTVLAV